MHRYNHAYNEFDVGQTVNGRLYYDKSRAGNPLVELESPDGGICYAEVLISTHSTFGDQSNIARSHLLSTLESRTQEIGQAVKNYWWSI